MNQPITENGQLFVLVLCSALRTKEANTSASPVIRQRDVTADGKPAISCTPAQDSFP